MREYPPNLLSKLLKKRVEALGYPSLKKFYQDRKDFGYSYELLRQVVYAGRIPRAETLLKLLQAMRYSPTQVQKLMELHFGGYPAQGAAAVPVSQAAGETQPAGVPEPQPRRSSAEPAAGGGANEMQTEELFPDTPGEIASSLAQSLPRIPHRGNEDFWETMRALARLSEKKVQLLAKREADQPLLFEKEPEAIYQFLVRKGKIPSFLSRGEAFHAGFVEGIDYRNRYRGALLGAVAGEMLGRISQGLSPRDIRELYGRIDANILPVGGGQAPPASLLLTRSLLEKQKFDPETIAFSYARHLPAAGRGHQADFARNLLDRGFPWFEAGTTMPGSGPAARIVPLALLRAADFRRMRLEAGIEASITHPNAAAIAGSIAQTAAIARILHTPEGALDALGFARSLAHAVSGVEPDKPLRGKSGRPAPVLWRKLGTELTALLLRRAEIEEVQEVLGNGPSVLEGIPFAWACFLRFPEDFGAVLHAAVNLGNDSEANASMAGALAGSYVGAAGIPDRFLKGLGWREELELAADRLLALARRDS